MRLRNFKGESYAKMDCAPVNLCKNLTTLACYRRQDVKQLIADSSGDDQGFP